MFLKNDVFDKGKCVLFVFMVRAPIMIFIIYQLDHEQRIKIKYYGFTCTGESCCCGFEACFWQNQEDRSGRSKIKSWGHQFFQQSV